MVQYRVLLVGAGGMGRAWANTLRDCPDTALVGWVDLRPGAAAQAADELGIRVPYIAEDVARAIAEVRPDFLVDVTTPEAHYDITLTALAAGVPVLGEKPMATSMEQAHALVAAAKRTGTLFMVSQSRRYDAHLHAYRRLIERHIGVVGILNADFYIGAHFGGFRDEMAHVLVLDMAIHTFDAARYVLGDADPIAVYCEEFNPPWSWYRGDASAVAIFEMAGGTRFTYRGSWCAEGHPTAWDAEWRAVGPYGTAIWDGKNRIAAEVVVERGGFHATVEPRTETIEPNVHVGIAGSLRDFIHALRIGTTPMGECSDNIKSLAMVFGAIESSATGRRVRIALER